MARKNDVKKREQLVEELRLQSEIIANLAEGVYLVRADDGLIVFTNPAFERMFGYGSGEMIGKHVSVVNAPSDKSPEETAKEIIGILDETGSWQGEINNIKKDGTPFWCYAHVSMFDHPVYGKVFVTLHTDITDRKNAESLLREGTEKLLKAQHVAGMGFLDWNLKTNEMIWSDKIYDLYGIDRKEKGSSIDLTMELVHPDDREFVEKNLDKAIRGVKRYNIDHRKLRADGKVIWVHAQADLTLDADGKPESLLGTVVDITERKQAEEEIRRGKILLESSIESPKDMIVLSLDCEYRYLYFNKTHAESMSHVYGTRPQIGDCIFDHMKIKDDIEKVKKHYDRALAGEGHVATDEYGEDPVRYYYEVRYNPVYDEKNEIIGITAFAQNITERKRAEEELQESEAKYRQLFTTISDAIMLFDTETREFIDVNDAALLLYGYSREEFLNLPHKDITAEPQESDKTIQQTIAGEIDRIPVRYHRKRDGTIFPVEISTGSMKLGSRTVLCGVIRDITERKQAEKEIKEKSQFGQTLLDAMPCVAMLLRPSTREIVASNEAARKFGAFPGKTCFGTWAQRHEPCPFCLAPKVWETGEAQHMEIGALDTIWDAYWFPIQEDLYLHYAFDITEKRKMEARLQRSQKMESMGLMAGGIAHDLNNILSGIVSYPELILMDLPEDSKLRKPIETIKDSGMRAADVVSDLLTIARGVASGKEVLNLNTMVEEYLASAEHQNLTAMHSFITFKADFDNDLLNIICSSIHIKKSLTNLVTNAAEAIKGDGTVKISTMNRYLDEPLKGYEEVKVGEYAVLSVSDDGLGISEDDLERIFEPFYTKKVMGRSGTGLGLAVVWNTVQDHNGYINVNTSEKGTAFELYFPVTRDEAAAEKIEISMKDYIGHCERILVVDDEEQQREIACNLLVRLDYKAEAVSSGEEAVEYLKKQSVDLVVLDMIMPKGMNGRETFEEILKIHPKQKAIIASGFSETIDVKKAQSLGAGKYIKKPYTMEKIGMAVKEELEK